MSQPRGRLTKAQQRALEELLPRYRMDADGPIDSQQVFEREAPLGVEIGFGMGDSLLRWASSSPDWNLLGVEIYAPGIGALLNGVERLGLENVRVAQVRAETLFADCLPASSVREVRILFPDPWPKKRHHKRRLIRPEFVEYLVRVLEPGGHVYLATDWADYADWALEVFSAERLLANEAVGFAERDAWRAPTKFEQRGLRLGHEIFELKFARV